MAEFINASPQVVGTGSNVIFTNTTMSTGKCIRHREGSGLFTLRGLTTNRCNARFLITYGGNIAINTGETQQEISLAISIEGEPINSTRMRVTPVNEGEYFNVSSSTYVEVPAGCCLTVAVTNTSAIPVIVDNSNLIITRVA